jgi:hypothetical protein
MGSVAKVFKKAKKVVKKPLSKITKGIARGIAKVGKSVMKGVAKLNKKLGPVGMIGLSIAMPYALSGLSSMTTAAQGYAGVGKTWINAVGTVGNHIRTGYTHATGAIGQTWSTITKSISSTFQKFAGNFKGQGNIWSRISQGAKNLFNSARNTVKKFTPKFRAAKTGNVQVFGDMGEVITMSAEEAQKRIIAGTLDASQLSNQTLGSEAAGWFTKGQTSAQISANDLVTETINNGLKEQVSMLDGTAQRVFSDHIAHQKAMGSYINNEAAYDSVMNSNALTRNYATDFDKTPVSYSMDLSKNKDYSFVGNPNEPNAYTFTGGETYNNNIGKSSIKKASKLKSASKYAAGNLANSLLRQDSAYKLPEVMYASTADMTQTTTGGYGGTEIEGSWGGSLLQGAFSDDHRERIMNFYKNMNIVGSH